MFLILKRKTLPDENNALRFHLTKQISHIQQKYSKNHKQKTSLMVLTLLGTFLKVVLSGTLSFFTPSSINAEQYELRKLHETHADASSTGAISRKLLKVFGLCNHSTLMYVGVSHLQESRHLRRAITCNFGVTSCLSVMSQ